MNAIAYMHERRFPNIYTQAKIIYILPLTINICFAIKAVGFSKVWQTLTNIFVIHYSIIKH